MTFKDPSRFLEPCRTTSSEVSYRIGLREQGRVEIIQNHHQQFGNLYNDLQSLVVWRLRPPQ